MPTNVRDPRSIVTPDAFGIDEGLLGLPLARPWRRFWAMMVDLIVIGVLTVFTDSIQLLVWGVVALFFVWVAFQKPGRASQAVAVLLRVFAGCLGLTILSAVAIAFMFIRAGDDDVNVGIDPSDFLEEGATVEALEGLEGTIGREALRQAESPDEVVEAAVGLLAARSELGGTGDPEAYLEGIEPDEAPWLDDADSLFAVASARWRAQAGEEGDAEASDTAGVAAPEAEEAGTEEAAGDVATAEPEAEPGGDLEAGEPEARAGGDLEAGEPEARAGGDLEGDEPETGTGEPAAAVEEEVAALSDSEVLVELSTLVARREAGADTAGAEDAEEAVGEAGGEAEEGAAAERARRREAALRRRAAGLVAADSLDRLEEALERAADDRDDYLDDVEDLREELADEQNSFVALLRDIWDQAGSAIGLWSIYFTVLLTLWKGRTVGKRALGLRVVRLDGGRITWWSAFERAGGYVAGLATGLLGFAQVFWDPNRQCIHDKIVGTVVVVEGAPRVAGAWKESHGADALPARGSSATREPAPTRDPAPTREPGPTPAPAPPPPEDSR